TATIHGSHVRATVPRPAAAASAGKSEVVAPIAPTSRRAGSRPYARIGANAPLSVMYAAIARNVSTTSDFRLPAPARMRVLLPQPDASVMPKPNSAPPTRCDSHGTFAPV